MPSNRQGTLTLMPTRKPPSPMLQSLTTAWPSITGSN